MTKKFRLYPDTTEIFLDDGTVTFVFEEKEFAKQFYEVMEKFRGREFQMNFKNEVQ